jgi:hypothetical protein
MFNYVDRPFELISYILGIEKCDLDELAIEMLYVGSWSWELITCLLYVSKDTLVKLNLC